MRKIALTLATAAAALGLAAPASATWYGQPTYGYSYGYNHGGYHHARQLQYRVDRLQREILRLARYRAISSGEYHNLLRNSRNIERRLYNSARFGLSRGESYMIQRQIAGLEYRIARDVRDGRHWAYRW